MVPGAPRCLLLQTNACKTSEPSQTKILAEGRDKFPSANKTEAGEKQCACFAKCPLNKAGGPKVARPPRALTGAWIPKRRNFHPRKPLLPVAVVYQEYSSWRTSTREKGKNQSHSNFGILFVPKQVQCSGHTNRYFLIHLQNLLGEINKNIEVQQSKIYILKELGFFFLVYSSFIK